MQHNDHDSMCTKVHKQHWMITENIYKNLPKPNLNINSDGQLTLYSLLYSWTVQRCTNAMFFYGKIIRTKASTYSFNNCSVSEELCHLKQWQHRLVELYLIRLAIYVSLLYKQYMTNSSHTTQQQTISPINKCYNSFII